MRIYVKNSREFAADCAATDGQCPIAREDIIFLDNDREDTAIGHLQRKCGNVVILRDTVIPTQSWLYHTSCERMTDVARQIFLERLEEPAHIPQPASEMTVGQVHRRRIALPYDECRAKVAAFSF
jgi:hypothetical protein